MTLMIDDSLMIELIIKCYYAMAWRGNIIYELINGTWGYLLIVIMLLNCYSKAEIITVRHKIGDNAPNSRKLLFYMGGGRHNLSTKKSRALIYM